MPTVEQIWRTVLPAETRFVTGEAGLYNEVSWALTLKPSPPGLESLRGGEFVLMSSGVVESLGVSLARLVGILAERAASGVGLLGDAPPDAFGEAQARGIPFLLLPPQTDLAGVEAEILRLVNSERNKLYQKEREFNQVLMGHALAGMGIDAIVRKLQELTGRTVALLDPAFIPLFPVNEPSAGGLQSIKTAVLTRFEQSAVSSPAPAGMKITPELAAFVCPVLVTQQIEGYLALTAPAGSLDETDRLATRVGALALAVELSRRKAVAETEDRFQSEFLETILNQERPPPQVISERAKRLGLDLSLPHVALSAEVSASPYKAELMERKVRSLLKDAWCRRHDDTLFVLQRVGESITAAELRRLGKDMSRSLSEHLEGTVSLGIGRFYPGPEGIGPSAQEAERALLMGSRLFGKSSVTFFGDLGVYRLLFSLQMSGEVKSFHQEYLGGLAEYDRKHSGELIQTLEVWLRCNTIAEAAKALNVHRNTLLYRLRRIGEISGLDLEDGETRLLLHLALRAGEVIRVT